MDSFQLKKKLFLVQLEAFLTGCILVTNLFFILGDFGFLIAQYLAGPKTFSLTLFEFSIVSFVLSIIIGCRGILYLRVLDNFHVEQRIKGHLALQALSALTGVILTIFGIVLLF